MKKFIFVAALAAVTALPGFARSEKRGVSESSFTYKAQMEALAPGVSWYYNWANTPGSLIADYEGMEYVPMVWNGNYSPDKIREYVKAHPGCKYLLGFNEPNFTAQANMTPQAAAALWPDVKALADELNLRLVSPALNYSPNPPYTNPMTWMDEFVSLVGNDAFDYIALHNYGGLGVMQTLCNAFHERYGKDIWVTEFCYWPEEGNANSTVSPQNQINSMVSTVYWLEKTPWIYRYAWFKAIGAYDASKGPNYGLLKPGRGEEPRELTPQGEVYVNLGTFSADDWHPVNTLVPAVDFSAMDKLAVNVSQGANSVSPIEISEFNSGAWAEYQFEVPAEGATTLTLVVNGFGEPTRYDPDLAVYLHDGAGEDEDGELLVRTGQFALPDTEASYSNFDIALSIPAGRHTIRIKDMRQRPSGMHIQAVRLGTTSGVDSILADGDAQNAAAPVEYYTLQGIRVASPAPGNIYIRRQGDRVEKLKI